MYHRAIEGCWRADPTDVTDADFGKLGDGATTLSGFRGSHPDFHGPVANTNVDRTVGICGVALRGDAEDAAVLDCEGAGDQSEFHRFTLTTRVGEWAGGVPGGGKMGQRF